MEHSSRSKLYTKQEHKVSHRCSFPSPSQERSLDYQVLQRLPYIQRNSQVFKLSKCKKSISLIFSGECSCKHSCTEVFPSRLEELGGLLCPNGFFSWEFSYFCNVFMWMAMMMENDVTATLQIQK